MLPVLDLRAGRAVHAKGGRRECYRPVESVLHRGDDPLGLALAFRDVLGLGEFYCADLDAIGGGEPDVEFLRPAAGAGLRVWVDAGLRDDSSLDRPPLQDGNGLVIAATETLRGPAQLAAIHSARPGSVVFGLDLREGRPIVAPGSTWPSVDPAGLLDTALENGLRRLLILDSARIGTGRGVGTWTIACDLIRRSPGAEVTVGGGVASMEEILALADLGVSAVLVGSALHDGRIGAEELQEIRETAP